MTRAPAMAALLLIASTGCAENLGNYGDVFPVIEEDIRKVIMSRLQKMKASGELIRHQRDLTNRTAEHVIRPKPLGLMPTNTPETYRVDPSVMVTKDVYTEEGVLLAKAGTRLNPFKHVPFTKALFFFNGDDRKQVAWVKKHYQDYNHVKFILTGGDIRDAAEIFGRIYFDQGGTISQRLEIRHVPAVVVQDGLFWKVTETGMNDE